MIENMVTGPMDPLGSSRVKKTPLIYIIQYNISIKFYTYKFKSLIVTPY